MWPYFTVPLEGHIRQVWLYINSKGSLQGSSSGIHQCRYTIWLSPRWLYILKTGAILVLIVHTYRSCAILTTKVVSSRTVRSWRGVLDTTSCDKVCQWLAADRWFSPGTPVSSINKTDRHDITELFLKVALNTTTLSLTSQIKPRTVSLKYRLVRVIFKKSGKFLECTKCSMIIIFLS